MEQSAQNHFDTLLNLLLPFALEMIERSQTFYPFGGFINQSGEFEQLSMEHIHNAEPKEIVNTFLKAFEEGVRSGDYRAFGICALMRAELPGQQGKQNVIVVSMEDETAVAVDSYLPYDQNAEGAVTHGQLISELVEPTVFLTPR